MSRLFSIQSGSAATISGSRAAAALLAAMMGLVLLSAVGFAAVAHDAAHDTRHSVGFPCH